MKNQNYDVMYAAIEKWLISHDYNIALAAMKFGAKHHDGMRKDGVMKEFQHQISQANYARTLYKVLMYPEEVLATIFLHDVVEDIKDVTYTTVREMLMEAGCEYIKLERIMSGVEKMTNQWFSDTGESTKKSADEYYGAMVFCPVASICKGIDRIHNHQTMFGVFSVEKMENYITETEEHIITMLRASRKIYTAQEPAIQNIKTMLIAQMELVENIISASK